jgi:hypothetical protein
VIALGLCSVKFAFTKRINKPVLKNCATKTPFEIAVSYSDSVSTEIHVINFMITVLRTRLIAIITKEMAVPNALPVS